MILFPGNSTQIKYIALGQQLLEILEIHHTWLLMFGKCRPRYHSVETQH